MSTSTIHHFSDDMSNYLDRQRRIIAQNSRERKELEKQRIKQNEKDYWREQHDMSDEDHDWDREPKLKENE